MERLTSSLVLLLRGVRPRRPRRPAGSIASVRSLASGGPGRRRNGRAGTARRPPARPPAPASHRRAFAYAPERADPDRRARPDRPAPRGARDQPGDATTTRLDEARALGADLVVFPELGLTGYQLQDLASEVAMRLDDPRLARSRGRPAASRRSCRSSRNRRDHRLFIAAALLEDGEIRHVHRKLFLPTYGLFDERRFFAAGDVLRAVPSRLGSGSGSACARTSGTCPCRRSWRSTGPRS